MLGIAAMLARFAYDSSVSHRDRAVFSSIATILTGALAAQSIAETVQNANVAHREIQMLFEQNSEKKRAA